MKKVLGVGLPLIVGLYILWVPIVGGLRGDREELTELMARAEEIDTEVSAASLRAAAAPLEAANQIEVILDGWVGALPAVAVPQGDTEGQPGEPTSGDLQRFFDHMFPLDQLRQLGHDEGPAGFNVTYALPTPHTFSDGRSVSSSDVSLTFSHIVTCDLARQVLSVFFDRTSDNTVDGFTVAPFVSPGSLAVTLSCPSPPDPDEEEETVAADGEEDGPAAPDLPSLTVRFRFLFRPALACDDPAAELTSTGGEDSLPCAEPPPSLLDGTVALPDRLDSALADVDSALLAHLLREAEEQAQLAAAAAGEQ